MAAAYMSFIAIPQPRATQAFRFVVAGALVTAVATLGYWLCVAYFVAVPLVAAVIGHLASMLVGFRLHAHWTFRGHRLADACVMLRLLIGTATPLVLNAA